MQGLGFGVWGVEFGCKVKGSNGNLLDCLQLLSDAFLTDSISQRARPSDRFPVQIPRLRALAVQNGSNAKPNLRYL